MAGGIFISYRRDDSRHAAGRLVERLGQSIRREHLFMDVDGIGYGRDFVDALQEKVAQCDVMLVLIGPQWLNAVDTAGRRRLDDPNDFVRIEVEAALKRNISVVPVLLDGAAMPGAQELPEAIASLARRNAIQVRHEQFGADIERLLASASLPNRIYRRGKAGPPPPLNVAANAVVKDLGWSLGLLGAAFVFGVIGTLIAKGAQNLTGKAAEPYMFACIFVLAVGWHIARFDRMGRIEFVFSLLVTIAGVSSAKLIMVANGYPEATGTAVYQWLAIFTLVGLPALRYYRRYG
jgi:TIR domain